MRKLAALLLMALPTLASAETITFKADSEILILRISQSQDRPRVELLASRDGSILCVAMDDAGAPLATTTGYAELGRVTFRDIDAAKIDRVVCRYN